VTTREAIRELAEVLALPVLVALAFAALVALPASCGSEARAAIECEDVYVVAKTDPTGTCPLAWQRIEPVEGVYAYVCRCPGR